MEKKNNDKKSRASNVLPSIFNISSLIETKWDARIEGKQITEDDFNKLIDSDEPLVNLKGKWILVDKRDVEDLRNSKKFGIKSYLDALKLGLIGTVQLQENGTKYDVIVEGELREIVIRGIKGYTIILVGSADNNFMLFTNCKKGYKLGYYFHKIRKAFREMETVFKKIDT